ncbi:MAG: PBSX family phage terminase large subunit [Thomasclavelia sp.]
MKNSRALFKFKPFSKKQRKVLNWWCSCSPVKDRDGIICDGAIRSGKTVAMALSFVMWAMESFDGENFGMAGKTIGSFRRNVLAVLKLMLKTRGYKVTDHRADNMLTVTRNGVTNYFYIFGGKDERSQDLIQGITLAGMLFDEVALMPESFVNQATARCSVAGSKWWFNCNPAGPFHWFKVNWIDKVKDKNLLYLHFTMDDNLSLSESIKERYRRQWSGVFYDRYILGLWAVAEGIIYDMFDRAKNVVKSFEGLTAQNYVSCDYGTQNAMVFLLWEKGTDGIWYCTKEYYYSGRDKKKQKTDSEYADDLVEFIGDKKIRQVIVDPSAASFIAELKKRKLSVKKAKNDVANGIREVATALSRDQIKFYDVCKMTIKEFATYAWDPKASQRGEDKPIKENDHCMDAVRYFVYTVLYKRAQLNTELKGGI